MSGQEESRCEEGGDEENKHVDCGHIVEEEADMEAMVGAVTCSILRPQCALMGTVVR